MPDEPKKIIVDDDWKAEARREKERLVQEASGPAELPPPSLEELVNLIAVQALAAMGLLPGPGGERIPPQVEVAKHFIDMLQLLEDKTRNNLTPEEKRLLDQVLYETRMSFVQAVGGGAAPPGAVPPPPKTAPRP